MKTYRCARCHENNTIARKILERKWVIRGYKYEYWGYFAKCPKCGYTYELDFFKLPLKVKWQLICEKVKNKI